MQTKTWQAFGVLTTLTVLLLASTPAIAQDDTVAVTRPGDLALQTSKLYREQARYPGHSWPLQAQSPDPLRAEWTPDVQTFKDPDKADGPELKVWSAKVNFEYPKPAVVHASLTPTGNLSSRLGGEVVDALGFVVGQFAYLDDGEGADKVAGDGIYTARLDFLKRPELAESYLVRVQADLGGELLHGVGGFLYSRPWARLTGKYKDRLRDGDLVVSAQVEVEQPGRFHLAGALHSVRGEPIGVAQAAVELEPGFHWIDLSFYGLMFHDRKVAGPYRLGSLALSTTGGMPNAKSELLTDVLITKPYQLAAFHSKSFADPELEAMAERLAAEAAWSKRQAAESRP